MLARGVPQDHLTFSSDSNGSMPKWGPNKELIGITYAKMTSLFGQIQSLVKKGLPLEQALCFVTQNVAQALELYPRKGCLAPESDADLVVIGPEMEIQTVVAKGQVLMEEGEVLKKGLFED